MNLYRGHGSGGTAAAFKDLTYTEGPIPGDPH